MSRCFDEHLQDTFGRRGGKKRKVYCKGQDHHYEADRFRILLPSCKLSRDDDKNATDGVFWNYTLDNRRVMAAIVNDHQDSSHRAVLFHPRQDIPDIPSLRRVDESDEWLPECTLVTRICSSDAKSSTKT